MRISDWSSDVCSSDLFKTGHNLYSRLGSGIDYSAASQRVHEEAERQLSRLDEIAEKVDDPKIERAREKIDQALAASTDRSEERRVGKECVSTCRCRWSPYNQKKKN